MTASDTGTSEASSVAPKASEKRPRHGATFVLRRCGTRFDVSEAAIAQFADGLLHRLHASELTAHDEDGAIPITHECDRDTFALAVAEHEYGAKRYRHGPPLPAAINPQALAATWDYLQLPFSLIDAERERPETQLRVVVSQGSLQRSLAIAQQLHFFLAALQRHTELIMRCTRQHPTMTAEEICEGATCTLALCLHDVPQSVPDFYNCSEEWDDGFVNQDRTTKGNVGRFPRELFELLLDKERTAALARRFMPDHEETLKDLRFRMHRKDNAHDDHVLQELRGRRDVLLPQLQLPQLMEDAHYYADIS